MAVNDPRDRVEDVEELLFWKEVKEAVKRVELNHGLEFNIERGTRKAGIGWRRSGKRPSGVIYPEFIVIKIYEVEPKQPALLVP